MRLFRINPTIRETNKYLSETVDELLKKHGSVSNEEFERDLISVTGIGWKQVKNYKNHPKPGQRLKDNTQVIKFVRSRREKDNVRKIRIYAIYLVSVCTVIFAVYKYATTPNRLETFVVHEVATPLPEDFKKVETKVFIQIRNWVLRLGPFKHSDVPLDKFNCTKLPAVGLTNCSFSESGALGMFQAVLVVDQDFVRKYSVTTFDPGEIENLRQQLSERVDASISSSMVAGDQIASKQFKVGNENVEITASPSKATFRPMLNVSVSF